MNNLRTRTTTKSMSKPNVRKALDRIHEELLIIINNIQGNEESISRHEKGVYNILVDIQNSSEVRK